MRTIITPLIAAALVAGSATSATAAVISFPGQNIPIPTTYVGVSVHLETGATSNALAGATGANMNFAFGGEAVSNDADQAATSPTWQPVRVGTGSGDVIENLGIDTVVGPSSDTATGYGGSTTLFPTFTSGLTGYIGFSVVLDDGNDTVAYGWVEVTLQDDNTPGVIHAWAYEDTGASLRVAAIPEPTHTLFLALGLSASVLRRRR